MQKSQYSRIFLMLEGISARARNGLTFSKSPFDLVRYKEILKHVKQLSRQLSSQRLVPFVSERVFKPDNDYVTPKVAVSVATFNAAHEVLLVKRDNAIWTLPGGYAEVGLDPIENAQKEVFEETGIKVGIACLVGVYDSSISHFPSLGRQVYTLGFLAIIRGGSLKFDPTETKGAGFFATSKLPRVPKVVRTQVKSALYALLHQESGPHIDHKKR